MERGVFLLISCLLMVVIFVGVVGANPLGTVAIILPEPWTVKIYNYSSNLPFNYTIQNDTTLDVCKYQVDSGNWTLLNCLENATFNVSFDGNHTITFFVNETTGDNASISRTFTVDTIGPGITIYQPIGYYNYNTSLPLNYTVTDAVGVDTCWFSVDGGVINYSGCINTTFDVTGEGQHNVTVWANDTAGNVNSSVTSFTVDMTPPNITGSLITGHNSSYFSPANQDGFFDSVTIYMNASELVNWGTTRIYNSTGTVKWFFGSANVTSNTETWDGNTSSGNYAEDGNYTINTTITDLANNTNTVNIGYIYVDNTPPATTDNAPTGWQTTPFNVSFTCSDGSSGCGATHYRLDSGYWQTGTSVSISSDGNHTVEYFSQDNVLNNESLNTVYAALDLTDPVASAASPIDNYNTTSLNVTFQLACSDNLGLDILQLWGDWYNWAVKAVNTSPLNNTVWEVNISLPDYGFYNWAAWCNDSAGRGDWSANRTLNILKPNGLSCANGSECYGGYCVHGYCRSGPTYCGDGFCDTGETCSSCSADCGACPTPASSGGGGWYPVLPNECRENWVCSDWSECIAGERFRNCTETNQCGTAENKPVERETCTGPAPESEPRPKICSPGDVKCSGNNLLECNLDGTDWHVLRTCESGCTDRGCVEKAAPSPSGLTGFVIGTGSNIAVIVATALVILGMGYYLFRLKRPVL